jgi:hypothetical protein
MTRPSKRQQRKARPTPEPEPGAGKGEERKTVAEVSRGGAEKGRNEAEQARASAEEGRELAEEIRRGAESLRLQRAGTGGTAEHGRHILEEAVHAEAWFKQRFDVLLAGVNEVSSELKRLREEAAELRQLLSEMQQAAGEERIISAERQASQERMDRERFGERG